jgi:hypothetical protein
VGSHRKERRRGEGLLRFGGVCVGCVGSADDVWDRIGRDANEERDCVNCMGSAEDE